MERVFKSGHVILLILWLSLAAVAQTSAGTQPAMKLEDAVALAETNYPSVRTAQAQVGATAAGIDLARTAYAPRLDLLWQENRATVNNIFGTTLPQGVIPSITGPVLGTKSFTSTFGTSTGALFSWEPFDFGYRKANVEVARDQARQVEAAVDVTRLDVATFAADAFLAFVAAQEAVHAAEANVARAQVLADSVHVQVTKQLRAG